MLRLLRLTSWRHMVRTPLRSILTVLGVSIGVATLVGITSINSAVMKAFRSTIDTVAGKADLSIAAGHSGFDESVLETVKKTPGVLHASGTLNLVLPVKDLPQERLLVMGVDLLDDGFFREYEGTEKKIASLTDDLEFLNSTDRLLLSERFAATHKLKEGDTLTLMTPTGAQPFIIHELLKDTGPLKAFGGSVAVMFLGSAQEAFSRSGHLDRIDVATASGQVETTQQALLSALAGGGFEVERPGRRGQSVEQMVRSFQLGLNLGSAVALLVGVFLVYNTVAIGVMQRRREIGTLRALGATRRRIRFLFALEAMWIGALGSAIGIALGTVLGRQALNGVTDTVSSLYFQVRAEPMTLQPTQVVLGIGLGVFGSLFAALRPAEMAARVQPVEALRRDALSPAGKSSLRWSTGAGLVMLALTYPMSLIPAPVENLPIGGYLAMFCILMGTSLLAPRLLASLRRLYSVPARMVFGVTGKLAAENFSRSPVRTAVPVSALAIGVGMTLCVGAFVGSFQRSSDRWIERSVPADLFISSSSRLVGVKNTPMDESLANELAKLPYVEAVDKLRVLPHDALGLRIYIISLNPELYNTRGNPEILEGTLPTWEQRQQGWVTISENLSRRRNLHPGTTFKMRTPTGEREYRVAAVIIDYTSDQGTLFMDRRVFVEHFKDTRVDTFELYLTDRSQIEATRSRVTSTWGEKYDLYVLSHLELRAEAKRLVDDAFAITYAMEIVAALLALLGVINTLLAAIIDRTREIGLLRAIGASQKQIVSLFMAEAALMGVTGSILGAIAGYFLGYIITQVVGVEGTGWRVPYMFPALMALQFGGVAALCATVAGFYPARKAAKLIVVEALAYE